MPKPVKSMKSVMRITEVDAIPNRRFLPWFKSTPACSKACGGIVPWQWEQSF
jgi:hypothetical protein